MSFVIDLETEGLGINDPINYVGVYNGEHYGIYELPEERDTAIRVLNYIKGTGEPVGYQHGKWDTFRLLRQLGIDMPITHDSMILGYLCSNVTEMKKSKKGSLSLKTLAQKYLGVPDWDIDTAVKKGKGEEVKKYLKYDLKYTYDLIQKLLKELCPLRRLTYKLIMRATNAYKYIESNGVPIDLKQLEVVREENLVKLDKLLYKFSQLSTINFNSPKQLQNLLYNELGLPVTNLTKTGQPSTNEDTLLNLKGMHPVVDLLLELRETKKCDDFLKDWKEKAVDGKLYPTFNLHTTVTGRTSCNNPNLQQVPREKALKSLFRSNDPEWEFVQMDYSQIELRIAAIVADVKAMKEAYIKGEDLHTNMATVITRKNLKDISKEERTGAKAANFGYLYGMGAPSFCDYAKSTYGIKVTPPEAQLIRGNFFTMYPELPLHYQMVTSELRNKQYIRSIMSRVYEIEASHLALDTGSCLRGAINFTVQGTASDYVLCGIIELVETMRHRIKVLGTVHDSVLMLVRKGASFAQDITQARKILERPKLIKNLLNPDYKIDIPIVVDVEIGPWGCGVSLDEYIKESSYEKCSKNNTKEVGGLASA